MSFEMGKGGCKIKIIAVSIFDTKDVELVYLVRFLLKLSDVGCSAIHFGLTVYYVSSEGEKKGGNADYNWGYRFCVSLADQW